MNALHVRIKVTGQVQGVFFRKYTKQEADRLGIKGMVCNKPDGSVYIEAEGPEEKIKAFTDWCHKGSPSSRVEQVHSEKDRLKGYTEFIIERD